MTKRTQRTLARPLALAACLTMGMPVASAAAHADSKEMEMSDTPKKTKTPKKGEKQSAKKAKKETPKAKGKKSAKPSRGAKHEMDE